MGIAEALDKLPLLIRQGSDPLLKKRCHVVGKTVKGRDEIVKRLLGEKLREQHVHAMIATSQIVQRANPKLPFGGLQISDKVPIRMLYADPSDQLDGFVDRQGFQVLDIKEPKKGFVAIGYTGEQLLSGGQGGYFPGLLQKGSPLLLTRIAKAVECLVHVLGDKQQVASPQSTDGGLQNGQCGIVVG